LNFKQLLFTETATLKYLIEKGGISFLFRITGMILGFVNMWLITNFFNAETYGVFSLIQTFLLILSVIFTLGIQNVIVIELSSKIKNEASSIDFLLEIVKIILAASLIPSIVIYFGKEMLSDLFQNDELVKHLEILSIAIPFILLHEIFLYYFIGLKKFIVYGLCMFFLPNAFFSVLILLFKSEVVESYLITLFFTASYFLVFILEIIIIFNKVKIKHLTKKMSLYKSILSKSLPMMLSGIMVLLLNWTDVIMLGIMRTEDEVGIYNAAFKIGFMVMIVISTFNVIIIPKMSELFHKGNLIELKKVVNQTTRLVTLLTLPLVIFLIVFGKFILSYFGPDFIKGYNVLIIITIASLYNTACGNGDQIMNFSNNQNTLMKLSVSALVLNIILNVFFIKQFGIEGAAFSSLLSTIFFNTALVLFIKNKLGFYTFK
jgi:O-antigen/teichoic acid export membrane protein